MLGAPSRPVAILSKISARTVNRGPVRHCFGMMLPVARFQLPYVVASKRVTDLPESTTGVWETAMAESNDRDEDYQSVKVPLRFLADGQSPSEVVATVDDGSASGTTDKFVDLDVVVQTGRVLNRGFSLDREGFCLQSQSTSVSDFDDDEQVQRIYNKEVVEFVMTVSGARSVEIFDQTKRSSGGAKDGQMVRRTATTVHNDYSALSGLQSLLDHNRLDPDRVLQLLKRRFAIFIVWRSRKGVVSRSPLAMCSASSAIPEDYFHVTRRNGDRLHEVQIGKYNANQEWYYYPNMQPDEAIIFKSYDSEVDGRARFTLHCSMDGMQVPTDAPSRESIETRCFAFF
jgi:hypothetical protein